MFKKTMKFDDLNGNETEATFYFNFTKKEAAELLEFGYLAQFPPADPERRRPLEEQLERLKTPVSESGLSQAENNMQAYEIFQDLILDAYGEKGQDNVTFVKNERTRDYLKSHVAFVEMIFEFLAKPQLGGEFVENCLPPKLVAAAKEEMAREEAGKTTNAQIGAMVAEADRRQNDPATAIEPGDTSLLASGQDEAPYKAPEDLTAEDVKAMDDIAFKKLDVQRLSRDAMLAAFQRKNQG